MKLIFSTISSIVFCILVILIIGGSYLYQKPLYNPVTKAKATVAPIEGSSITGTVYFEETKQGLYIKGEFSNLKTGKHGFHIHQWGDCSCKEGTCAGGHFNPMHENHGGPNDKVHHAGDLGNIEANKNGVATYIDTNRELTLNGINSIVGRSVIIHADEDNFVSQPTGNSGARIGCGIIGIIQKKNSFIEKK